MPTATVRIGTPARDRLRALSRRLGKSMREVLEEAVEAYRRIKLESDRKRGTAHSESLAQDPNVLAYQALDDDFLKDNAGRWVAFCDGDVVAIREDRESLFASLRQSHPVESCLIQELTPGKPRTVHFRRPRRMKKTVARSIASRPAPPG